MFENEMQSKFLEAFSPQEKTLTVDYETTVQYKGRHREVAYLISEHSFKKDCGSMYGSCPSTWCTYILLTEEKHEEFKAKIEDAPWNGGQTYYCKFKEEHIDLSPSSSFKDRLEKPYYKIGDDFNHIWDNERYDMYSKEYMERHIKTVIDYLIDHKKSEDSL